MKTVGSMPVSILVGVVCSALSSAAPVGQYTIVADAGVVVDNKSGLTWQRDHSDGGLLPTEANAYCSALNVGGFASGWRVPKKLELETLLSRDRMHPAIDPVAFPDTPRTWPFWTSTPFVGSTDGQWAVDFDYGISNPSGAGATFWVRCVR